MSRSFRVDFTKGISAIVDPSLLGDGFAVMVDNADVSAFAASSYRAPVFRREVPVGTKHIFEYRGKWWFSSEHREWAAEFVGRQERLYYTESGYAPGEGKIPMKIIDGVAAPLGLPRPLAPVTVDKGVSTEPPGLTLALGPVGSAFQEDSTSATYRIGYRTAEGLLPPGPTITIAIPKNGTAILKWSAPNLEAVVKVVIYGRTSGKEQILEELVPEMSQFIDDGSLSPHGEYASNLDTEDVYFYFHTFIRDVNGHIDESGPSPLTGQINTSGVRKITRNPQFEGMESGTPVLGAAAYKTATSLEMCGSMFSPIFRRRIITTKTVHALVQGDEIGIVQKKAAPSEHTAKQVFTATLFDSELAAPTISDFSMETVPLWASGTTLNVRVSATWIETGAGPLDEYGNPTYVDIPHETAPSSIVSYTPNASMQALVQWTAGENERPQGFNIYVNGVLNCQVSADNLSVQFGPASGSTPIPTVVDGNPPTIVSVGAPGLIPVGTQVVAKVTSFRGSGWGECFGGAPAESLPSSPSTITATHGLASLSWSPPSGDADGFHVYLNDKWVATLPATVQFLEFRLSEGDASRTVPIANGSRSRVFHIADDPSMVWYPELAAQAPLGFGGIAKPVETRIVQEAHGRAKGDLLSFSGYEGIRGPHVVARVGSADEFYLNVLTEADDATSITRRYSTTGEAFRFVKQWALYVQSGATGGIPLQQGVYPIEQTEVIDGKPIWALSVTCPSAYYAQTPEGPVAVEFEPPPRGFRRPTLHNSCLWGIVDNAVVWSPVNRPDAYPRAFRRDFPFPPVALASYAGALVVLLPNGIGRFDGTDPANMSFSMTAARDGCNAPNSVQHTAAGLMYSSSRGLMAFQAEINTSVPITAHRVDPSLFSSASSTSEDGWPGWWIPTRSSAAWAKCTRELPSADGQQRERMIDETLPIDGILEDIRSFYWRGRYYIYFTGSRFGRHGTILVDTTRRGDAGYPVFHLGLRPSHAHVSSTDKAFILMNVDGGLNNDMDDPDNPIPNIIDGWIYTLKLKDADQAIGSSPDQVLEIQRRNLNDPKDGTFYRYCKVDSIAGELSGLNCQLFVENGKFYISAVVGATGRAGNALHIKEWVLESIGPGEDKQGVFSVTREESFALESTERPKDSNPWDTIGIITLASVSHFYSSQMFDPETTSVGATYSPLVSWTGLPPGGSEFMVESSTVKSNLLKMPYRSGWLAVSVVEIVKPRIGTIAVNPPYINLTKVQHFYHEVKTNIGTELHGVNAPIPVQADSNSDWYSEGLSSYSGNIPDKNTTVSFGLPGFATNNFTMKVRGLLFNPSNIGNYTDAPTTRFVSGGSLQAAKSPDTLAAINSNNSLKDAELIGVWGRNGELGVYKRVAPSSFDMCSDFFCVKPSDTMAERPYSIWSYIQDDGSIKHFEKLNTSAPELWVDDVKIKTYGEAESIQ